jgi:uncharacterized NAD(P)/FAD-binding protein YdhS
MEDDRSAANVVIIGGGFSGTMLAAELARRGIASTLIEGSGRAGEGTAFSTDEKAHLLNVPAGRMGAWADQPSDFASEVAREGYEPHDFVPRKRYGEYLRKILKEAEASGRVKIVRQEAVEAERTADGWSVRLPDGMRVTGQALALAHGNQAPLKPPFARGIDDKYFINDPWTDDARAAIARSAASGGDVLLIGTGLTMVDMVLTLDEVRLRGRMTAVSRRGQVPRSHADHGSAPVTFDELPQGSLRKAWRWLLDRGASVGWRAAVDSLRPHSHALWQSWSMPEQRRFMRHARPWWDVHRHRIAPEVFGRIKRLVQIGRLEIVAGQVTDMWIKDNKLDVSIKRRGSRQAEDHSFALAVNCTGPLGSIAATRDPLLQGLFEAGLAKPDALDLGLEVDERSRVQGGERIWALGPLTKGKWWEITAVPDIRGQVSAVAEDIAKELGHAVQS